jgi:hypothetical protein
MALEMVGDILVAVEADDLGEIGRDEDPLGVHVLQPFDLRQLGKIEAPAHLPHHVVEERGMPGLIARHALVDRGQRRVFQVLVDFAIKEATRELPDRRAVEELVELAPERIVVDVERVVFPAEMRAVPIRLKVAAQVFELRAQPLDRERVEDADICPVEPRGEQLRRLRH